MKRSGVGQDHHGERGGITPYQPTESKIYLELQTIL